MENLLYISGSYPENKEGIAGGAKVLLDAMVERVGSEHIVLLTTNIPIITDKIAYNSKVKYYLLDNWNVRLKNIKKIFAIIKRHKITCIHMEYPGDLYGKTFLASFLPLLVKFRNLFNKNKIVFGVRLHEFSRARLLRKIAIVPIVLFSSRVFVPAEHDRNLLKKIGGKKIKKTIIGSNIKIVETNIDHPVPVVSYFGSVYPGKGIEKMIELWKEIKKLYAPQQVLFKIIGEVGVEKTNHFRAYHEQVWEEIRKSGIEKDIIITGYILDEEVSAEISKSDVATLLYEDGLTLRRGSFIAYLSHGIPIVTTMPDHEAGELIENADGVFTSDDMKQMANKVVEWLHEDPLTLESMYEANASLAKVFSWSRIAQGFNIYYGLEQ